jgi:hypothetical protein
MRTFDFGSDCLLPDFLERVISTYLLDVDPRMRLEGLVTCADLAAKQVCSSAFLLCHLSLLHVLRSLLDETTAYGGV